jgi:A/G-specific adenine glycosylase
LPRSPKPRKAPARAEASAAADTDAGADAALTGALIDWFHRAHRPLPWRTDLQSPARPRDPYVCLVVEAMSQQTQLSRVADYLARFLRAFPTLLELAQASEADVLAQWSGLGYYRRARHLHAAARAIVHHHQGLVPADVESLRALPGIGPYTAGALSAIVFGRPVPVVDGNVTRVLLRISARTDLADPKAATRWAHDRADALMHAATGGAPLDAPHPRSAPLAEGLMELGATICLPAPATPKCEQCPLRPRCAAAAHGLADQIPAPKPVKAPTGLHCSVLLAHDARGRVLVEQRPATGMWASMWQAPTLETGSPATRDQLGAFAQLRALDPGSLAKVGAFTHQTTHRTCHFVVLRARPVSCARKTATRRWCSEADLATLGLSTAARRALAMGSVHEER